MNHHAIGYVVLVCSSLLRSSEEVYVVYDTGYNVLFQFYTNLPINFQNY